MVQGIKDNLKRGEVKEFRRIDTKMMLADILTKDCCQVGPADGRAQDRGDAAALLGGGLNCAILS